MVTSTLQGARVRPVLMSLCALVSVACGGGTQQPQPKDPPQVLLSVPEPVTMGQSLRVSVTVSGCDAVQSLEIFDGTERLKTVTSPANSADVTLAANEIRYTRGIAAKLSLTAKATCVDGRNNTSQPQPATFFPATKVVELPGGLQPVPDYFVTEGKGSTVAFIGCGNDANGRPSLYRTLQDGSVTAVLAMPFPCTVNTTITDRNPQSGKRWVWTPNGGAIAVDNNLNKTGETRMLLDRLVVGPDGDAIAFDAGTAGSPMSMVRVGHTGTDNVKWKMDAGLPPYDSRHLVGQVIGDMVFPGTGTMVVPLQTGSPPLTKAELMVGVANYATGEWVNQYLLMELVPQNFSPRPPPPVAFDASGQVLYVGRQGPSAGYVMACAATSTTNNGACTGSNVRWTSPDMQSANLLVLVPYFNGSRIAAVAAQQTWFLDASNGSIVSKGNKALVPSGALVTRLVQPGNGSDFYLLNGSSTGGAPLEIIATDAAEKGELYRFETAGGGIFAAVDDDGIVWMRVGRKLVQTLPLANYRQVVP